MQDQLRTFVREPPGNRTADCARSSGDHDNFSTQIRLHRLVLVRRLDSLERHVIEVEELGLIDEPLLSNPAGKQLTSLGPDETFPINLRPLPIAIFYSLIRTRVP